MQEERGNRILAPACPTRPRAHPPSAYRGPLIAFNVNLATDNLEVAREIARAIRSAGGLPFVKAIGVRLANRALVQVSMNLTNYERTPMFQAFDFVKREADERGVGIVNSEVVGLVPTNALIPTTLRYLQLDTFRSDQVFDARLSRLMTLPPAPTSAKE